MKSFGNWEIDTIFGKDQKSYLLTIVEMRTKYTIIRKIVNKEAAIVKAEIDKIMAETVIIKLDNKAAATVEGALIHLFNTTMLHLNVNLLTSVYEKV